MSVNMESVTRFAADVTQMEFHGEVFTNYGIETVDVRVDDEGTVRAWDDIAEGWTVCHAISDRDQKAIREAAKM